MARHITEEHRLQTLRNATLARLKANDEYHTASRNRIRLYWRERAASQRAITAASDAIASGVPSSRVADVVRSALREFRKVV